MIDPVINTRPYQRTGKVLIDAIMHTAWAWNCTAIRFEAGIICFNRDGIDYSLPYRHGLRCTAVFDLVKQGTEREMTPLESVAAALEAVA